MRPVLLWIFVTASAGAGTAPAQDTLPPSQGGTISSLGLPEIYKPYFGVGLGVASGDGTSLTSQLRLGTYRDIASPVTELLGWSVEYQLGVRDVRLDHGVRAQLVSHLLGLGVGAGYSLRHGTADLDITLLSPVRRGGILGRGTDLRLEWRPTHGNALNVVFTVPLSQPHRGATRPLQDAVSLPTVRARPAVPRVVEGPELRQTIDAMRTSAGWIARLTAPALRGRGGEPGASAREAVRPLAAHLAAAPMGRTVDEEIRAFHEALAQAFAAALASESIPGRTALGDTVAAQARRVLLERVLLPYDRLLGQRRRPHTTRGFADHARGVFARWLVTASPVSPERTDAVIAVFQHLLDLVEAVRAETSDAWGDDRLVWLPLQLALLPEEYDDQEELDSIVSRAVGHAITHGNRIWYIHNDRFQTELIRSIGLAEDYHVLWVHDFRGVNEAGRPDRLSVLVAAQAYLSALRARVARYDRTGHLPAYMLFLDQHYFEVNRSRDLLNVLQDPLGRRVQLRADATPEDSGLADVHRQLLHAVDSSRLLQAEWRQYGDHWLHHLVKVHVSITNPADPSFRSAQILPLLGVPDDVMRDHRKAVLYDVSEADPYRGMAMYAGMGVGEHYAGPMWEDRAIMLQGPAALALRDEARALLETHGLRAGAVPHVLRPQRRAPDYARRVQDEIARMDSLGEAATRAIELHNQTGFATKEVSVADAVLFSLFSPGGVLKIPDSLWLNEFLASLLTGAALRGVRVLMIMPSGATAPSAGWPQLALMHELASRLLAVRQELEPFTARVGGLLRLGLYDADVGVYSLGQRVIALRRRLAETPFLRELYSFDPAVYALLDSAEVLITAGEGSTPSLPAAAAVRPRLHFKGFLYVSSQPWRHLITGPAMAPCGREYVVQRRRQLREGATVDEQVMEQAMQRCGAAQINPVLARLPESELRHQPGDVRVRRWVMSLQVGSLNQDYRSMVMDGEAVVLVSAWTSLLAMYDFILLTGLTAWIERQEELDRLLRKPSRKRLALARWVRMAL